MTKISNKSSINPRHQIYESMDTGAKIKTNGIGRLVDVVIAKKFQYLEKEVDIQNKKIIEP